MNRINVVIAIALTACGEEVYRLDHNPAIGAPVVEAVWADASEYVLIGHARALTGSPDGVLLQDPRTVAPTDLGIDARPVVGGAWVDGKLVVASGGGLHLYNGTRWDSPLNDAIEGQPTALLSEGDGRSLWLADELGWMRWSDGNTQRVQLDGAVASGPIAVGASIAGQPVTWVSHVGAGAAIAAVTADGTIATSRAFEDVRGLTASVDGLLWVADGRVLNVRDSAGSWTPYQFNSAVANVWGNAASDQVYIRTVDSDFVGGIDGVSAIDLPDGEPLGVDERGRIFIRTTLGVSVASVRAPIALLDVPTTAMEVPTTITVDPPGRGTVTAVMVSIDSQANALEAAPPWRLQITPSALSAGEHTLTAVVSWVGGSTDQVSTTFDVADRAITWDADVRVLFEDRCAQCHGGSSETVLDFPDAWVLRFDRIMELVETEQMPLGQRSLDNDELALLRAWRTGGFE